MFEILDGRSEFYQWDSGRQIKVKDESITQLHFCNRTDDCSLCVEVVDGIANVPNILLQDSWNIKVYGFDKNYTKHCEVFKVVARSKPSDYIYTETEVLSYIQLEKRLDEIEKNGVSDDRVANSVEIYFEKNPIPYPVTSVNGKDGAVVLTAEDIGAATVDYVDNAVENIEIPDAGEGCKIGKAGTAEGAEIFNDYDSNVASGIYSVAQGMDTKATGLYSHAEGAETIASSNGAHAEGINTQALGICAHSEGQDTIAKGNNSHAEGFDTIAAGTCQHVSGQFNIEDTEDKYVHIVGNGVSSNERSNAYTLDRFGNGCFSGDVYVWGTEKLATEAYVNEVASGGVDLSSYATKNWVENLFNNLIYAEDGEY